MKLRILCVALTALALGATVAAADTNRVTRSEMLTQELSLKGVGTTLSVNSPAATVNYSDTTTGGPTWTRPFASCTGASGLGPFRLHAQNFNVTVSGAYTLSSVQNGWDGYIFVYNGTFDPNAPLTNCVTGNDDGAPGDSALISNLTAGTNYVFVTTGFDGSTPDEGTFTNTIDGPGAINLAGVLPAADLGIVKTAPNGVAAGGDFIYRLVASNAGPTDSTNVTVTDTLPAGVTFVTSDCGAAAVAGVVTWSIGALNNGATSTCNITVNQPSLVCPTLSNTASISSPDTADGNSANNSSTTANGGESVADPSFENATSGWALLSSNFGSPLCDIAGCGAGAGTVGPRTGNFWVWFGGHGASLDTSSATQTVTIPTGANTLTFGYWLGVCGTGGANDFVRATVGGTEVWRRDATSADCGAAGYSVATVDITAFATGAAQVVRFESTTGTAGDSSNFSIDDVSIASPPVCAVSSAFNVNTSSINFGNISTGSTSAPSFITLTNTGGGSGTVQAPVLSGPFALSGGTCPAAPFTLAGGASCTFGVVFAAGAIGNFTGSFTVNAGTDTLVVALAGGSILPSPNFIPANSMWMLGLMIALMGLLAGVFVSRRQG